MDVVAGQAHFGLSGPKGWRVLISLLLGILLLIPPAASASPSEIDSLCPFAQLHARLEARTATPPRARRLQAVTPVVRMIYLLPQGRTLNPAYTKALDQAIHVLQIWYARQLGNTRSFLLHQPVVEVVPLPHDANWYGTNPNGNGAFQWWFNVYNDALATTGGGYNDPNYLWVYYIDSDNPCGQFGGAADLSVVIMPANDLRGLAVQPEIPACGGPPELKPFNRWLGGLGHEMGHALGLPHPYACEDNDPNTACPYQTMMFLGYLDYPVTSFLESDLLALRQNPFIQPFLAPATRADPAWLRY